MRKTLYSLFFGTLCLLGNAPAAQELSYLKMSSVLRESGRWTYGINSDGFCLVAQPVDNSLEFWLGKNKDGDYFVAFFNNSWRSLTLGSEYSLNISLGDRINWTGRYKAVTRKNSKGDIFRGLLQNNLKADFVSGLNSARSLRAIFDGRLVATISLDGLSEYLGLMANCASNFQIAGTSSTRSQAPNQRTEQSERQSIPASPPVNPLSLPSAASASLRCENERGDAGIAACNEAIRLNPNDAISYNNRGVAHRLKGDLDRALVDFTAAIGLDPRFGRAHFHRALVFESKGDFRRALDDMRKYIENGDSVQGRVIAEGTPAIQRLEKIVTALSNPSAQPQALSQQQGLVSSSTASASTQPLHAIPDQGRRIALVIGNTQYKHTARLENPTNDADLIASSLRSVGFQTVTVKKDLTREETVQSLREFRELADAADWAVLYYAGHGIEFGGVNYLIPIDARLRSDRDIELEAVAVSSVESAIDGARRLRLVILDACRDNPFASQMRRSMASRSMGRGLAQMEPRVGTLISYAAKHGETADDGSGENSPFALAFAQRIKQSPPLEIRRLFDTVRDDVLEVTRGKQQPFTYHSITSRTDFFFAAR